MNGICYGHDLTVGEYRDLRVSVGWSALSERQAAAVVQNSSYFIAARAEGRIVGMARLVSDGGYVAYIADVVVRPDFQGKGIGKAMMTMILRHIRESAMPGERILACLMAAKDREPFYEGLGFSVRPNGQLGAGMSLWIDV